ncbi:MAG: hypothetical protein ACKOD9_18720, partial [Rubrivivax sp.]
DAVVSLVLHLGEIPVATLHLTCAPHARLTLTLAGAGAAPLGAPSATMSADTPRPVAVRLDTGQVHVMPVRSG